MRTGSEIILDTLLKNQVTKIFGYPGGAIMPVYDALLDYTGRITHYRFAHEQGAVHATDGFARATGQVGVCFVTSGPGATNTITGLATAYMDSVPIVVFSGQVPMAMLGKDSFQEIDITSISEPITKKTYLVDDVDKMAAVVQEAIDVARSGRPGPVLVDLPKDILLATTDQEDADPAASSPGDPARALDTEKLGEILLRLSQAERPLIYAGGGVKRSNTSTLLKALAIKGNIPVVNTLMGLGTFPMNHALSLGLSGMHGHPEVNEAVSHTDLLLVIGARFSDRAIGLSETFARDAYIVQLDIDETEFSKNIHCDLYLDGDLSSNLAYLVDRLEVKKHTQWLDWIQSKKYAPADQALYCPENIIKTARRAYPDETILVTDTGQHQMWAAQHWWVSHPRGMLTSGGLGTMGYGLGAAIGACIGNPDTPVVLISGDGSFRMNANELLTVAGYDLNLTILMMNNESLGMVRQWQKLFNNRRYSETNNQSGLDYLKLAEAYGVKGVRVDSLPDLKAALEASRRDRGAHFIEVRIDPDEDVYPFVPPGKSIAEYLVK